jgi:hypothetical protein
MIVQPHVLNPTRVLHIILIVISILILVGSLDSVFGYAHYYFNNQPSVAVYSPPVILEEGTAGSSLIYTNNTSAKVSAAASAPTPTYYPNGYNIGTGTYVSGSIPSSVQTVDTNYFVVRSSGTSTSTTPYNPSSYSLVGTTTLLSGTTANLTSNDGVYMSFRSYDSATSAQTLYAHQETTAIGGSNYYLQKLASADTAGISLSNSMSLTGRQLSGKFVYPLTGVGSIPSSTWTIYYRMWQTTGSIAFDAVGSGNNSGGSTTISWTHTTGSGTNRIMIVGVSIRNTTVSVSSITYGAQSLTFIRSDTHPSATIRSELWYLIAPASGSATVTVILSGASRATGGSCTYTGVDQTSPLDANAGGTGRSSSPSQSVTVNTANSWLLGHLAISGSTSTVTSGGAGQTMRWDQVTTGTPAANNNRGHGSDKGPVGTGSQTISWGLSAAADWAASVVALKSAFSAIGHADVDILIRQSDNTIRQTIATSVAASGNLPTSATTLSGTYTWSAYTIVAQTDYLEIDYYTDVTTASSAVTAYLRVDDNTLATTAQTRASNIYLPSEFTSEVEFIGSSNTLPLYQIVWTIGLAWTTSSVIVTIQVYNYTLGGYPTSGNGYSSYTSSTNPNTNETVTQTITTNATNFRDGSGNWKIKVKGVKTTATQFDFKADWIEYRPSYYTQYTASTEFFFSSIANSTPTQLNFTVASEYNSPSVSVTIQVWNYSSSAYVTSGQGYLAYTSSGSNETKLLSITTNPQSYTSNGNAKIKITGVLATITQYQQKVNQVKLVYKSSSSLNYDYVLKIVNQVSDPWEIRLKAYAQSNIGRLNNCTLYFHNSSDGTSRQIYIQNGAYVNQIGPWYNLPASPAVMYIAVTLNANYSQLSYVYVCLEILIPNKTTYTQYILAFEIT